MINDKTSIRMQIRQLFRDAFLCKWFTRTSVDTNGSVVEKIAFSVGFVKFNELTLNLSDKPDSPTVIALRYQEAISLADNGSLVKVGVDGGDVLTYTYSAYRLR